MMTDESRLDKEDTFQVYTCVDCGRLRDITGHSVHLSHVIVDIDTFWPPNTTVNGTPRRHPDCNKDQHRWRFIGRALKASRGEGTPVL